MIKRIFAALFFTILWLLWFPAFAGQVCTLDPARPGASKGFYVVGSHLYDTTGTQFTIRGVNHNHWDQSGAVAGIALSGANAVRVVMPGSISITSTVDTAYTLKMADQFIAANVVPILGDWRGTCKTDTASLDVIRASWVAARPALARLDAQVILNPANEWGPNAGISTYDSTLKRNVFHPNYGWRDGNIKLITALRAAGYPNTLIIDAGSCGQDATTIIRDGSAVAAADPLKNVMFSVHVYGGFHKPATASWMQDYDTAMRQLRDSGLPLIIGEFGPGRNVGPSPTMVTPQDVIATAESNGWGWMAWAWGDNNLPACLANDNGFSMTKNCGRYTADSDLTDFGRTVVPILQRTAVKAKRSTTITVTTD